MHDGPHERIDIGRRPRPCHRCCRGFGAQTSAASMGERHVLCCRRGMEYRIALRLDGGAGSEAGGGRFRSPGSLCPERGTRVGGSRSASALSRGLRRRQTDETHEQATNVDQRGRPQGGGGARVRANPGQSRNRNDRRRQTCDRRPCAVQPRGVRSEEGARRWVSWYSSGLFLDAGRRRFTCETGPNGAALVRVPPIGTRTGTGGACDSTSGRAPQLHPT